MEWSWLGSTIVAVASLIGVVVTVLSTSRLGLRRLRFETEQAELSRVREARSAVREGVEHIGEVMLDAVAVADYDASEGPNVDDSPFVFDEDWHEWFEPQQRQLRREVARIRDENTRILLEMVVQSMDYAYGIATHTSHYKSAEAVVRDAGLFGFEVATAWLREQGPSDVHQATADRLMASLKDLNAFMQTKIAVSDTEEAS